MLSTSPPSFRALYQDLVSSGAIEADAGQADAVEAFTELEARLASYRPARKQGFLGRLFADKGEAAPRGLYVLGEGGGGEALLMRLFCRPRPLVHQSRTHFYDVVSR